MALSIDIFIQLLSRELLAPLPPKFIHGISLDESDKGTIAHQFPPTTLNSTDNDHGGRDFNQRVLATEMQL